LLDPALAKAAGFFFVITGQPLGSRHQRILSLHR
jgi:hypothetical protein